MQTFTDGDVTLQVEIDRFAPNVGSMGGYRCDFTWWLSIDDVEYVSGEFAFTENWWTSDAAGREGWSFDTVNAAIDTTDDPGKVEESAALVVERVLDWFSNLREDIVGAWMNTVNEYVQRANEYGDSRSDAQYEVQFIGVDQFKGQSAWAVVNERGEEVGGQWYDSKQAALDAIAAMQDA